ncbi:MAG: (4Fe-4S)-binding protein, partial [Treponema sp.]|nr:(4Fe-4S)-binding protein [Treponema sp.]
LVTEPTPFGLHDLKIAVETVRQVGYPFGVVINRSDAGDSRVLEYCESEKIPVLLEIKEDMDIAKAYSIGKSIVETKSEYIELFTSLYKKIEELVEKKNIFQKPAITTGVKL